MKNKVVLENFWIRKTVQTKEGVEISHLDLLNKMEFIYIEKLLKIIGIFGNVNSRLINLFESFLKDSEIMIKRSISSKLDETEIILWSLRSRCILEEIMAQSFIWIKGEKCAEKRIQHFNKTIIAHSRNKYRKVLTTNWFCDKDIKNFANLCRYIFDASTISEKEIDGFNRVYDLLSSIIHNFSIVQLSQDIFPDLLYYIRDIIMIIFNRLILPILHATNSKIEEKTQEEVDLFEEEVEIITPSIACEKSEFEKYMKNGIAFSKKSLIDSSNNVFKFYSISHDTFQNWNLELDLEDINEQDMTRKDIYSKILEYYN